MMAAAPAGMGGGQADNTQPEYGVGGGPAATRTSREYDWPGNAYCGSLHLDGP